jgi:hypothetical protein
MTLEVNWKSARNFALAAMAGMILFLPSTLLWAVRASEFEIKAAYLYNFGRFVEWPAQAPSTKVADFPICVLGQDPFGPALDSTVSGEKIDGKDVTAKRILTPPEAVACRVVFVSSSEVIQIKEILSALGKYSVLTVSDIPDFLENGGMVQFVLADRKVRFKINLAATRQAGLNLSSQLLKVAEEVRGGSQIGD